MVRNGYAKELSTLVVGCRKEDIMSSCTYHTVVSPLQSLELLGIVLAEQCHIYINCHS